DVYGELARAMFRAARGGLPPPERAKDVRRLLLEYLASIWREPDEGIWEVRGGRRHFTHSNVMAWVAFDRAARDAASSRDARAAAHWRAIADQIHAEVCRQAFDPKLGSFVQSYGSRLLDASLLQIPLVGFLPPTDPRVRGTIAAIERCLLVDDFLVLRYDTEEGVDGLPPGEGAFLACSFRLARPVGQQGRHAEARALFERLLAVQNDVGLLAEEYDPRSGRMLGNFPQAYSHVGLINTALNLSRAEGAEPLRGADDDAPGAGS